MLAGQMVVTHGLAMDMLGRTSALNSSFELDAYRRAGDQVAADLHDANRGVGKLKRGGEQTVRVEHVHVYSGGQAVVGAVSINGRREG